MIGCTGRLFSPTSAGEWRMPIKKRPIGRLLCLHKKGAIFSEGCSRGLSFTVMEDQKPLAELSPYSLRTAYPAPRVHIPQSSPPPPPHAPNDALNRVHHHPDNSSCTYSSPRQHHLSMPDLPPSPQRKTVSSASANARNVQPQKKPGAPKPKGAVRAKSGCYTCRIRRKVRAPHQERQPTH